jgi:hypothetical protein
MKVVLGMVVVVLIIGAQSAYAESAYKAGYREGVKDFNAGVFHQLKLIDFDAGHSHTFGNGYVDGWRASCLKAHPEEKPNTENGCELTMDAGNP